MQLSWKGWPYYLAVLVVIALIRVFWWDNDWARLGGSALLGVGIVIGLRQIRTEKGNG